MIKSRKVTQYSFIHLFASISLMSDNSRLMPSNASTTRLLKSGLHSTFSAVLKFAFSALPHSVLWVLVIKLFVIVVTSLFESQGVSMGDV